MVEYCIGALTPEEAGHHEAGHAVVAYLWGRKIISIQINEVDEGRGAVHYEDWFIHYGLASDDTPPPSAAEDEICIHLGSFVAQELLRGEQISLGSFMGDHQYYADSAMVNEWLVSLVGKSDGKDSPYMITARRLLDVVYASLAEPAHWNAVKTIAASIATRKSLTGDEATEIIE